MARWIDSAHGKSIQQCFEEFNKDNPKVYELIVAQCDRAIRGGKKKFSIKQIIGWIRWEVYMETKEANLFETRTEKVKFKINDAYTSRYARLVIERHPEWAKYIEMRDLRS